MTEIVDAELEIATLRFADYNPRRALTSFERDALEASLADFGAVDPAVVNADLTIISGHQRIRAAAKLGWTHFPCRRVDVDKVTEQRMNLALNKIQGDWDLDLLADLIVELTELDADFAATGFSQDELDALVARSRASAGLLGADEIPDQPEPITRPGQIWRLGRHRLGCLDATEASDVSRLLEGACPQITIADPPYGVNYRPEWRAREAEAGRLNYAARRTGAVPNDDRVDWRGAWEIVPGDVLYVWHGGLHAGPVQASIESAGFELRAQIIWAKRHLPISRGAYHWQHEPLYYCVRRGAKARWVGGRHQSTLWDDIVLDAAEGNHGAQKPVEAIARAIRNHAGDVYDPFCGSGTGLIAAELEGRSCFALEISASYVDLAVTRWERFTGERAALEDE